MKRAWWTQADDLDEHQKRVLRLPPDGSYLIEGPPGSGKTNLIVLRAKFLINSGRPNLKVVVFTRSLKEFIVAGSGEYGIDEHLISTIDGWSLDFLGDHGWDVRELRKQLPDNFAQRRRELAQKVLATIADDGLGPQYGTILIDEAQDLLPVEVEAFGKLSNQLYAVADAKQKIYSDTNPLPSLRKLVQETLTLTFHYRNGAEICRLADIVGSGLGEHPPSEESSQYDEVAQPSTVEEILVANEDQQFQILFDRLAVQLKTYPGELIGLLTPRTTRLQTIAAQLAARGYMGAFTLHGGGHYDSFNEGAPICVSTLHSAKGLEFRACHMLDMDTLNEIPHRRPNLAYMGITRAKTALSVYHTGNAPPFLIEALREYQGGVEPAEIEDLFGA